MKSELATLITSGLQKLVAEDVLRVMPDVAPQIDHPKDTAHGDLSCNIAMVLAKQAKISPRDLAAQLIAALPDNTLIERTDIAGPAPRLLRQPRAVRRCCAQTHRPSGLPWGRSHCLALRGNTSG